MFIPQLMQMGIWLKPIRLVAENIGWHNGKA